MTKSKLSPQAAKELEELTKLVSGKKSPRAERLKQREAAAVLGYIDSLEKAIGTPSTQNVKGGEYDEHDKKIGLLKLFGIAAGLPHEETEAGAKAASP